jgi:hypothetical protein
MLRAIASILRPTTLGNRTPTLVVAEQQRFATKLTGSSRARQKRRPEGKRLGLKKYPGTVVSFW